MVFSTMNGRIRSLPDKSSFSITPISLPSGMITVHSIHPFNHGTKQSNNTADSSPSSNEQCSIKRYNLSEILCPGRDAIVDHRWTYLPFGGGESSASTSDENEWMILAVLTRQPNDSNILRAAAPNDPPRGKQPPFSPSPSAINLYIRNPNPEASSCDLILACTIPIESFAYSIAMEQTILAVGKSSGMTLYSLERQWAENSTVSSSLTSPITATAFAELLPSFPVHAMTLSVPFLVAASGHMVGVWRVDRMEQRMRDSIRNVPHREPFESCRDVVPDETTAAIWSTKVTNSQERITSIDMTSDGELIALSYWDGSALVFQADDDGNHTAPNSSSQDVSFSSWRRLSHSHQTLPWELPSTEWQRLSSQQQQPIFPTFVCLCREIGRNAFMAVSTPGSCMVRWFDLDEGVLRCDDVGKEACDANDKPSVHHERTSIHGMISIPSNAASSNNPSFLVWIDHDDILHRRYWPAYRLTSPTSTVCRWQPPKFRARVAYSSDGGHEAWIISEPSKDTNRYRLQCRWKNGTDFESVTLSLPFLTEMDVKGLVQRHYRFLFSQSIAEQDVTVIRRSAFAIVGDSYLGIVVPDVAMGYIYNREMAGWREIDMDIIAEHQENCDLPSGDDIGWIDAWFVNTHFLVSVFLDGDSSTKSIPSIGIWDLSSRRDEEFIVQKTLFQQQHSHRAESTRWDTLQSCSVDNDSSGMVFCCETQTDHNDTQILFWEINNIVCKTSIPSKPHCLSSPIQFAEDGTLDFSLVGASKFSLDEMDADDIAVIPRRNDPLPKDDDDDDDSGGIRDNGVDGRWITIAYFKFGSDDMWLCIPAADLWRPIASSSSTLSNKEIGVDSLRSLLGRLIS